MYLEGFFVLGEYMSNGVSISYYSFYKHVVSSHLNLCYIHYTYSDIYPSAGVGSGVIHPKSKTECVHSLI